MTKGENRGQASPEFMASSKLELIARGLNHMDEGVTIYDSELRLVAWNIAFVELLEFPAELPKIGLPIHEFARYNAAMGVYGPGDVETLVNSRLAIIEKRQRYTEERIRSDGRIISINQFPIADGVLVITCRDVSDQRRIEAMARLTEERFRAFMDSTPTVAFIKDEGGRYVYVNHQFEKLLNHSADDIIGKTDFDMWDTETADRHVAEDRDALNTGERRIFEEELVFDGKRMNFLVSKFRFSSPDGALYLGGIASDATALKRAEEAVLSSEKSLESAQRIAQVGSWDWNLVTNDLEWSREVYRILGRDPKNFVPNDPAVIAAIHPKDLERVQRATELAIKNGAPYSVDHRIVRPTGEVRHVRSRGEIQEGADGNPECLRGTVQDVTDQWRAEQYARREQARAQVYLQIAGAAVFTLDRAGMITLINLAGCELLECEEADAIGKSWFDHFVPAEGRERRRQIYAAWMSGALEIDFELDRRVVSRAGNERYVRWQVVPLHDDTGNLIGILGSGQDITEQRQTEAQLRQAQKMEAVGQLASGIAHDFNNVLSVVMGNLEMATDDLPADNTIKRYLEAAMAGAQRGADLNKQLLTFSRGQVFEERVSDINGVLSGMLGIVQRTLGEEVKVETRLTGANCFSRLDPAQLESAILNLAINARDAMPSGGTLTIETRVIDSDDFAEAAEPSGNQVHILIGDTGTGMSPEVAERATEPFFTTKDAADGSGLGLSMVYGFVERSGGQLKIDSWPGQGTQINLFLPATGEGVADTVVEVPVEEVRPAATLNVLVVEDQPEVQEVVKEYLETLGYGVVLASNGSEAMAIINNPDGRIDVVLSDMVLPGGMDGFQILTEAKLLLPDTKMILMSGNPARSDLDADNRLVGTPLLRKPFRKAELAHMLRECLEEA